MSPDAEPDLLRLVQRTCQALQAMVASLEALDSVLLRLDGLGPETRPPSALRAHTCDTVARVVGLLHYEGPPLLLRAQELRLRLPVPATGTSAALALRNMQVDLDSLAAFRPEGIERQAAHWGACIRRLRRNAMILLAEFDAQRRRLTPAEPPPAPLALEAPMRAAARP